MNWNRSCEQTELTIHSERHPFANRWRHVVAGDAEIRPHLPPLDTIEMQQWTVVVVVLLESATTCVHERNILLCREKKIDRNSVPFLPFASNDVLETTKHETTEPYYVRLRLLHFRLRNNAKRTKSSLNTETCQYHWFHWRTERNENEKIHA